MVTVYLNRDRGLDCKGLDLKTLEMHNLNKIYPNLVKLSGTDFNRTKVLWLRKCYHTKILTRKFIVPCKHLDQIPSTELKKQRILELKEFAIFITFDKIKELESSLKEKYNPLQSPLMNKKTAKLGMKLLPLNSLHHLAKN
ncbi:hypothetical protein ACJX0J_012535, partial [Zea mays]